MLHKVVSVQNTAADCFVCGADNPFGLHAKFYVLEDGDLAALVTFHPNHQSYPGRVHGGAISALLDEAAGRVIQIAEPDTWAVTGELTVRFLKPVPYGVPLKLRARVAENARRLFVGECRLYGPDGVLLASGAAKYVKMPVEKIAAFTPGTRDWMLRPSPDDPAGIDLPAWDEPAGKVRPGTD